MLFSTSAAKHLAAGINVPQGRSVLERFSDGEVYVKVEENVRQRRVWVLCSTEPPAENLLELFFLLDVLQREEAEIHLLFSYFGYARQDRVKPGEAFSAKIVCDWLNRFRLSRIKIIHIHSPRMGNLLDFENIVPVDLFRPIIRDFDVFVAPDRGALPLVKELSAIYERHFAAIEKWRPEKDQAEVLDLRDGVRNKRVVIIDDMISTGTTILRAYDKLKERGAEEVAVLATHGLFAGDAMDKIERSGISKVYVTNSVYNGQRSEKIEVVDLGPAIQKIVSL